MMRLIHFLETKPRWLLITMNLCFVIAVGFTDYLTGNEISVSIFYLPPVLITAWFGGKWSGMWMAVLITLVWQLANVESGGTFSNPAITFWNSVMRLAFFLVIVLILDGLRTTFRREVVLARTDSLTGAANARALQDRAEMEIDRAKRYGHPLTVAYIDIDDLKKVNDRFGHSAGDELIREVAGIVSKSIRSVDMVARLGGDEFVVLLPETDDVAAQTVFNKLNIQVSESSGKNGRPPASVSVGVVTFRQAPETVDDMLELVDNVMYMVKNSGKAAARFEIFPGIS